MCSKLLLLTILLLNYLFDFQFLARCEIPLFLLSIGEKGQKISTTNKSQNLPIFKSWGPDCKLMTSTAHLAAMTCCNASVLSSPRLHLLVKIFLLDSSWPGCCLCRLTSTPVEERKKSKNYYCIVIDWYEDRSKIFDI